MFLSEEYLNKIFELGKSPDEEKVLGSNLKIGSYHMISFGYLSYPLDYEEALNIWNNKVPFKNDLEFFGYLKALSFISQLEISDISERYILNLHRKICYDIANSKVRLGDYKTIPNHIMSSNNIAFGRGELLLRTAESWRVNELMKKLIYYLHNTENQQNIFIKIGIFVGFLLYISPFQKGNFSIARTLSIFLIYKSHYEFAKYLVLWDFLNLNDEKCLLAISKIPNSLDFDNADWNYWLIYFIDKLLEFKNLIYIPSNDSKNIVLSEQILKLFDTNNTLSIAKIYELTGANRNTIKLHLKNLVSSNKITMHGKGRGVLYTK